LRFCATTNRRDREHPNYVISKNRKCTSYLISSDSLRSNYVISKNRKCTSYLISSDSSRSNYVISKNRKCTSYLISRDSLRSNYVISKNRKCTSYLISSDSLRSNYVILEGSAFRLRLHAASDDRSGEACGADGFTNGKRHRPESVALSPEHPYTHTSRPRVRCHPLPVLQARSSSRGRARTAAHHPPAAHRAM